MMRAFNPQLLKLDFGYGLPGPDVSAPRNPEFRGERLPYEFDVRIIVDAAREVKPDVTIQYYGIHPLMRPVTDVVALDDLGDAGGYEGEAHGEWSIWSALAAAQGSAIMASSGYDWKAVPKSCSIPLSLVLPVPSCLCHTQDSRPCRMPGSLTVRLSHDGTAAPLDGSRSGSTRTEVRSGANLPCVASDGWKKSKEMNV